MPKIIPVVNLRVLFDKILNNNWIIPSKISGMRNVKQITLFIEYPKINKRKDNK